MRSIKQHQEDAANTTLIKEVRSEPPHAGRPFAPSMFHANMDDGFNMWSEFDEHMAHQGPIEPDEDVDRAFELEFYGSDNFVL